MNNSCGSMSNLIISYNLMGGESYALVNDTDEYFTRLESLVNDIKQGKGESCKYLYFAFVSLASSTLEYSLNLMLATHCFVKYHVPKYEQHLQVFLDIKFSTKIEITPEIVSEGEFTINKEIPTLQCLKELVDKRNNLMHNSKAVKVQSFESKHTGAIKKDGCIIIPVDALNHDNVLEDSFNVKDNAITTLTSNWCIRMWNAILDYREYIITPYLSQSWLQDNYLLKRS